MKTKKFLSFALVLAMLAGMLPGMSLTASAAGNTTEITPTNTSGTMTITLTIKAAQTITASDVTATYGDTDKSVTASVTDPVQGGGAISYAVKDGSADYIEVNASTGALTIKKVPADGKAYVVVTAAETTAYAQATKDVTVTINKANAVAATVTANSRTYDGTEKPLVTVTGEATGGTMQYALGTATEATQPYTTSIPSKTDAGAYYVWYKVVGDANHNNTTPDSVTVTIAPKSGDTVTAAQTAGETLTYDGTAKAPTLTVKDGATDITTYAVKYVGVAPTQYAESQTAPTDAGSYKAVIELSGNYSGTKEAAFTIAPATLTNVSVAQNGKLTYTGEALTPQVTTAATAVNNQTVTFTYSKTQDGTYGAMPTVTNVSDGGTIYYKASAPNHNDAAGSFTVTVDKASQTAPAAPTKASATITSITLTAITNGEYSKDGISWQTSPTFTGLTMNTEYSFYQRIAGDANHNASPASQPTTIRTNNHAHNWSYQASGAAITATCGNSDNGHSGSTTDTLTIAAPAGTPVYDGTTTFPATIADNKTSVGGITMLPEIQYEKKNGETWNTASSEAPKDAGTYRAGITVDTDKTAYVEYTIAKAAGSISYTTESVNKTYGDAAFTNELTKTGDGTVSYASDNTAVATVNSATGEVTIVGAGTATITATAADGSNYTYAAKTASYTLNVGAATMTVNAAGYSGAYDGNPHSITVTVTKPTTGATITYGTTEGTYDLTANPEITSVNDSKTVYFKVTAPNYTDYTGSAAVTLSKADQTTPVAPTANELTYNGQAQALVTAGTATGGVMQYKLGADGTYSENIPTATNAGDYTVYYKAVGDSNHLDSDEGSVNVTIAKAPLSVTANAITKYVNAQEPELTYKAEGFVGDDTAETALSGALSRAEGDEIGEYDITIGTLSADNYEIAFTGAKLTIRRRSSGGGGGGATAYAITPVKADNGSVSVSRTTAVKGNTVTITVAPDEGYKLDKLTVTDKDGKEIAVTEKDGKYTFTMPAGKVDVTPVFVKDDSEPTTPPTDPTTPPTDPTTPPADNENPFVDVKADDYFYDAVLWAAKENITSGTTDTTFSPNESCTRGQTVTFLWREAGSPEPTTNVNPFTDVKTGDYFYKAVLWAYENGITKGTSDKEFSPNATVTRGQTVTFLYRSTGEKTNGNNPFTDVKTGDYYYDSVLWAYENDITSGTSDTTFSPNDNCLRGQIVTFLYRCNK